jgi:aminoglycoside N3'-acetyltransferase
MAKRSMQELSEALRKFGLEGKTVGVHSNLTSIGLVADTPVSLAEEKRGLNPIAKTIINALIEAIGPQGTFFVPTHSCNFIGNYAPSNLKIDLEKDAEGKVVKRALIDDGYYNKEKSPSLVGALTQSVIWDDRAVRSEHPTHSIAAIGKEAGYLVRGHDPFAMPVGIHNAFTKVIGLDGIILFIGDTLKSNTSFHAYETLVLPDAAEYFAGAAAAEWKGLKRLFHQAWVPNLHRDFYDEHKRKTRAINAMRDSGLLKEGVLGRGVAYYFSAKDMAKYFSEKVFPAEPDILFCNTPDTCGAGYDCKNSAGILKHLYAKKDGSWDSDKIKSRMDKQYLELLKPGDRRIPY